MVTTELKEKTVSLRQEQITEMYLQKLEAHIHALKTGIQDKALEINDFAGMLHVHPIHLSNTVKEVTGLSTCDHYEQMLLKASQELLSDPALSIKEVAARLTYDPSNFTKFFKNYTGITPKQFREMQHH